MPDDLPGWAIEAQNFNNAAGTYIQKAHEAFNAGDTRNAIFNINGALNGINRALSLVIEHAPAPMTDKEVFLAWMRIANG